MNFIPGDPTRKTQVHEREPRINFLDEKVIVTFKIEQDAAENLPEITDDDLETRRERYRILLGKVIKQGSESAEIIIKGIMESEPGDPQFYTEGTNEIHHLNIQGLQRYVSDIQKINPELKEHNFLGDIHTHPITPAELKSDRLYPWSASDADIKSIISDYEKGILTSDKPFIFAIAGRNDNGTTEYAFYRLVKKDDHYMVKTLD